VWANLPEDGSVLTVHVLDLTDEETWKQMVRHRYESLLLEIFE
jgi:multicomponent K+:H+ antiporter subunit E